MSDWIMQLIVTVFVVFGGFLMLRGQKIENLKIKCSRLIRDLDSKKLHIETLQSKLDRFDARKREAKSNMEHDAAMAKLIRETNAIIEDGKHHALYDVGIDSCPHCEMHDGENRKIWMKAYKEQREEIDEVLI